MIAPISIRFGNTVLEGTITLPDSGDDRVGYSVERAAQACDVSEDVIREAIRSGGLRASRPCRRIVIEASELRAWLANAARSVDTNRRKETA